MDKKLQVDEKEKALVKSKSSGIRAIRSQRTVVHRKLTAVSLSPLTDRLNDIALSMLKARRRASLPPPLFFSERFPVLAIANFSPD